jgi:hypothetical protein
VKTKFRVYISQINQQYYDVVATTVQAAEDKACRLWKQENGPNVCAVEQHVKAELV